MLEFVILMIVIDILCNLKFKAADDNTAATPEDDDIRSNLIFKSVDDCMEYRELRATGWRGDAEDFYKWKETE